MKQDLSKYNIVSNKSHKKESLISNIPDKYKWAWIAGYIDGDGSIATQYYRIVIVGNLNTIKDIDLFITRKIGTNDRIIRQTGKYTYELSYSKKEIVKEILLQYTYSSGIHLNRKLKYANEMLHKYYTNEGVDIHTKSSTNINFNVINNDKKEASTKMKNHCIDCGKPISQDAARCKRCAQIYNAFQKRPNRPNREILKNLIRNDSFLSIGKQYGVTDNAVRKWCKVYGLPYKVSEIKRISDEEWENI